MSRLLVIGVCMCAILLTHGRTDAQHESDTEPLSLVSVIPFTVWKISCMLIHLYMEHIHNY